MFKASLQVVAISLVLMLTMEFTTVRPQALAQARELGNPRGADASPPSQERPRTQARPSARAPRPGMARVRFEGASARGLVVTQLAGTPGTPAGAGLTERTTSGEPYRVLCRLACEAWLEPGSYRFGIGRDAYPAYRSEALTLTEATTINVQYDDHGALRIFGMIAMLVAAGAGILAFWAWVQNEPDYTLAGALGAGVGMLTGLSMLFAGDGVHFSPQPLLSAQPLR